MPARRSSWRASSVRQASGSAFAQPPDKEAEPRYKPLSAAALDAFLCLKLSHAPLAFNSTAGKDRTGIAAALVLTALGVPRATIIKDYLLTNIYLHSRKLMAQNAPAGPTNPLASMPPAAAQAMAAADRSYIEAAFHVLDAHPGGAEGWLRDEMGLSAGDLAKLRRLYLA